jgi:hypothetical protein
MNKDDARKKACQILRKRVRYAGASLRLPGTPFPDEDTDKIREATKLYVETWIVPLLDDIEREDWTRIKEYYQFEKGHDLANTEITSREATPPEKINP